MVSFTTPVQEPLYIPVLVDRGASNARIQEALDFYHICNPQYQRYINYHEGRHDLRFATDKFRNAFGDLFRKFADNLCPAIIDAAADRLQITGFDAPEQDEQFGPEMWKFWIQSRMPRKSGAVHEHALKTGDAYVIVWPDRDGMPVIAPNPAQQMYVRYEEEGDGSQIAWGTKMWRIVDGRIRLNLYYPDRIEKYVTTSVIKVGLPTKAAAFQTYTVPLEPWPVRNPYGRVPIFHFPNNVEMGTSGISELHHVIPLQDALNKSLMDLLVAMEFVALPQRWATGLELEEDPVTKQPIIPFKAGVDRIWSVGDPETKFGQFEQARMTDFIGVQNDIRLEMARISRTPMHYLSISSGGNVSSFTSSMYPSGESLKTAEAPFTGKIRDRQITFGDVWKDVMHFCSAINKELAVPEDFNIMWQSAHPETPTEEATVAEAKQRLGIPQDQIWSELGYTAAQIQRMKTLQREQQAQEDARQAAIARMAPPVQAERS